VQHGSAQSSRLTGAPLWLIRLWEKSCHGLAVLGNDQFLTGDEAVDQIGKPGLRFLDRDLVHGNSRESVQLPNGPLVSGGKQAARRCAPQPRSF
jgi:hypothetical protein